jgi:hypothetical protein
MHRLQTTIREFSLSHTFELPDGHRSSPADYDPCTRVSGKYHLLLVYWIVELVSFTRLLEHADKRHSKTIDDCFPGIPK